MTKLYLSDIDDIERKLVVEPLFVGEVFNNNAKIISTSFTVSYYKAVDTVSLTVKGTFEFESICGRCGVEIAVEIDTSEQYYIFPEKNNEDMDYLYKGDLIDLDPYFSETIVLNIPSKLVCDEDCKGRCPICGENKNDNECDCKNRVEDFK